MELQMNYQLYNHRGINPLLLKLIIVPEFPPPVKKKKYRRNDPEPLYAVADLVRAFPNTDSRNGKKIVLIKAEPGCGRSNLTSLLGASWSRKDNLINNIDQYDAVLAFSGLCAVSKDENLEKLCLPLCTSIHGGNEVSEWMLKSRILLVLDDAEELSLRCLEKLETLINEAESMDILILASHKSFESMKKKWSKNVFIRLELCGLGRKEIIEASEYITRGMKKSDYSVLKDFLTSNISRFELVLKHPVTLLETCEAWVENQDIFEEVSTCSDLLWTLMKRKIDIALNSALEIADNGKIKDWLLIVGKKALQCIKEDQRLGCEYMSDLEFESSKVFVTMPSRDLMRLLFKNRYMQGRFYHNELSVVHKFQQELLAAWFVAHQVIDGRRLNVVFEGVSCPYYVAVFMMGLLSKIPDFKWISGMHERRLITAAVNHGNGSNEDLEFNLDIVAEIKGLLRHVEMIVDLCEYPDEWNIDAGTIQVVPFESLLFHVAPTRIFLNVEQLKPYSELHKAIHFLHRVDIFTWLDSGAQFTYGNESKMDDIARSFFNKSIRCRIDLIKGCLSTKTIKEMPSHTAFSHLVFLKLRVIDFKNFLAVVKVPKHLPKLMWLEIKFDFPILEEDICSVPKTTVPLLDVYLQHADDANVSKLASLLINLHDWYTGIHLESTSLTPEGVFVLLKQLQKRNVYLHSPARYREQFRRWYYPQLSNFDQNTELTDERAIRILGFDDRIYYSNHHVDSSCFALALDSWNLSSYLEEETSIIQFTYKTDNLTCIKGLDGKVNVMVNGKRQVRTKEPQCEE